MVRRRIIQAALMGLLIVVCGGCRHLSRQMYVERQMGVDFRIVAYGADAAATDRAARAAFDRIAALNRIFSDYDAESELRGLGTDALVGKAQVISPELVEILALSRKLSEETRGAFDVSVGPCVLLWRQARGRRQLPEPHKVATARERVGLDKWTLDTERGLLTTQVRAMRFDLGAIAKGYAADAALAVLREAGISRALVDGGGDLALGDPPPGARHWRVRIEGGEGARELWLRNCAVATSGDTEQFVEIDGARYSHIVDPRTGIGMTNRMLVTTVAPTATLADAAASAVTVLGPEAGLAWAASRGIAVRCEPIAGDGRIWRSPGFPTERPAQSAESAP